MEDVLPKVLVKKYAFDIEVLSNAIRMGYTIASAPVEISTCFNSHINYKAIWHMLIDTCAVFYRMNILHYYDKPIIDGIHYNKIHPDLPRDVAILDTNIPMGSGGNMGIIGKYAHLGLPDENSYEDKKPILPCTNELIRDEKTVPVDCIENNNELKIK